MPAATPSAVWWLALGQLHRAPAFGSGATLTSTPQRGHSLGGGDAIAAAFPKQQPGVNYGINCSHPLEFMPAIEPVSVSSECVVCGPMPR